MEWYFEDNGERQGPLDDAGLEQAVAEGTVTAETLVWNATMSDWTAYGQATASVAIGQAHQVCDECGESFGEYEMLAYEGSHVCAGCKPVFLQKLRQGVEIGTADMEPGSMGRRLVAQWVDGFLLQVAATAIQFVVALLIGRILVNNDMNIIIASVVGLLLSYGLSASYEGYFYSTSGSTPGKSLLKVKVVRSDGSTLTFWRGFGLFFARVLVALPLGAGLWMAFFDEYRRGWHDRMCDTRVVKI